jgi:hypothetical protein
MSLQITREALRLLAMNNASCKVFGTKKLQNLRYLTLRALENHDDFDFAKLVAGLPETGLMYKSLEVLARIYDATVIDTGLMLEFLGGKWHLDYVLEQAKLINLDQVYDREFYTQYIFSHALIPARITNIEGDLEAVYQNGQANVRILNFIKHPFVSQELQIGQIVLLHQALVVGLAEEDVMQKLLQKELTEERFMSVAQELEVINYEKFWDLKSWTEESIRGLGI